jgi:two-component system response regulator FlrC
MGMATLHIHTPGLACASELSGILARRRVPHSAGAQAAPAGVGSLVAAACDGPAVRHAVDMARSGGIRSLVTVRENAPALSVEADKGGRHVHVALPPRSAAAGEPDASVLLLADILATPLRPMVAAAPASGALVDLALRVARSDVTVFVNGPTGSGKEVLARTIHLASRRAAGPFVAINCAAIPENMLEAMLFGHEKGAFTGANVANRGLIRAAEGGTLLLDEISEMPLGLQSKLLRVIQERQVSPLGASADVGVNIRIIATSNRDMAAEVRGGRFREDLFYRLNVFPLQTHALHQRREDIAPLAIALLRRHADTDMPTLFAADALALLSAHDWPGNVRELENVVQRALVLADGPTIGAADIVFDAGPGMVPAAPPMLAIAV